MYNPVIDVLGEKRIFFRSHLSYRDGKKKVPFLKPILTAPQAINLKRKDAWDKPGTHFPLVMIIQPGIMCIDFDNVAHDGKLSTATEEARERLKTYFDISMSGKGRHAFAYTDLEHLQGKKHVEYFTEDETSKIELFIGHHPVILTNKHDIVRPLTNCDKELQMWLNDLSKYGYHLKNNTTINKQGERGGGLYTAIIPQESFTGWLTTHQYKGNYPSLTKRNILQYIWNAPGYDAYGGWKPFYAERVAKQFNMTPRHMNDHLRELEKNDWLFRKHGKYTSGMPAMSVKLNIS